MHLYLHFLIAPPGFPGHRPGSVSMAGFVRAGRTEAGTKGPQRTCHSPPSKAAAGPWVPGDPPRHCQGHATEPHVRCPRDTGGLSAARAVAGMCCPRGCSGFFLYFLKSDGFQSQATPIYPKKRLCIASRHSLARSKKREVNQKARFNIFQSKSQRVSVVNTCVRDS